MTQKTRAEINSDADSFLADNNAQEISAEDVRQRIKDLADSAYIKDDDPAGLAAASDSDMEAATSTTLSVVPGRQHRHPGHPKCALKATVAGGVPTLQSAASYNIASITDTAAGRLTVTIGTDFSSAHWACVGSLEYNVLPGHFDASGDRESPMLVIDSGGQAAGSVILECYLLVDKANSTAIDVTIEAADPIAWHMIGMGDQA